jgi:glutathione synthase/RimK-type ligase-like ATP-grasp enzyme
MQPLIVILSYDQDHSALEVFAALQRRNIPTLLLDPGKFPRHIALDATFDGEMWQGSFTYRGEHYDLERIKSVFYRRPTHYRADPALPLPVQAFAENEASKGFGGILRSLDCLWVSHPDALRAAAFKPRQLKVAALLGLRTPRSLITNDAAAARRFYEECEGKMIYKTLHGGNIAASTEEYDAIYTSVVTEPSLDHIDRVSYTAHLFQEHIAKAFELRINVIGEHVFAAAIYSQHSEAARVDFRASYGDLRYAVYTLPDDLAETCRALVRHFGLQYGALDMAVTPSGEYVFFEVNPTS